jgi:hypothetical protein
MVVVFVTDMKPTDWLVAIAALAACAGVAVVLVQLRLARQVSLQHFSDYATRHQGLVAALPDELDAPGCMLEERPDCRLTLQRMRRASWMRASTTRTAG